MQGVWRQLQHMDHKRRRHCVTFSFSKHTTVHKREDHGDKEISLHLTYVHREINLSNEIAYHGRQCDVQSVHIMYE